MQQAEKTLIFFLESILYSYSQVFFSKNKPLAFILLAVSFFDWIAGISGLIAVITSNSAALLIGFKRNYVAQGFYGFNSLLVGLGIGMFYQPGPVFFLVLLSSALFTFFLTIWLEGFFGKYGLPYLSWPFLLAIWMVSLATRQFTELEISDRGVFLLNEIYKYGGIEMVKLYFWFNELPIHISIATYFKSLAAIFFQYHMLAGILVALGLLVYSRIAFLLSLLGFFSAYFFYVFIGANLSDLNYSYIGFNFILTAFALGGFFIVPSKYSFMWVVLLTPIISIVIVSGNTFLETVQLPVYSLAFNVVIVLFLYLLKFRIRNHNKPELVTAQYFSPEHNLYNQKNHQSRFDLNAFIPIYLPVMGEWTVTQAHEGEQTHREEWRHAFDFEMIDQGGSRFENDGLEARDYYSFGQVVIAPAGGMVQDIQDGIPDNPVGEMNLQNNWGNTIIIKHADGLYSKLSHLKMGSIKVKKGSFVKRGEIIASVGNSGRSPLPHLHFQLQSEPFIGAKTLDYPIANYILKEKNKKILVSYNKPLKDQIVSNISKTDCLYKAFNFVPGQTIRFTMTRDDGAEEVIDWEVKSDMYNYTYLECMSTQSKAYFQNDGNLFAFTHFEGKKDSLLYHFYLATYKVALGFYEQLEVHDSFPLTAFKTGLIRLLQDFAAPFYTFMKGSFIINYVEFEDDMNTGTVNLNSTARLTSGSRQLFDSKYSLTIKDGRFTRIEIMHTSTRYIAREVRL